MIADRKQESESGKMKRLHIYMEQDEKARRLRERLVKMEAERNPSGEHAADKAEICVYSLAEYPDFAELIWDKETRENLGLSDGTESLYLTENPRFAAFLSGAGYPVAAYVHEENRDKVFENICYAVEDPAEVDREFYVRIWQRMTEKPWHILDTERCSIRETTVEDVDAFYEIYGEPSVTEYMEDLFADREQEKIYIETYARTIYRFYGFGTWTVLEKESGRVIGRAGISMREGFDDPELGFVIGVPWQGKGIAREVSMGILQYAKEELGFNRIQAFSKPQNKKSVALLEKLGFVCKEEIELEGEKYNFYILVQ